MSNWRRKLASSAVIFAVSAVTLPALGQQGGPLPPLQVGPAANPPAPAPAPSKQTTEPAPKVIAQVITNNDRSGTIESYQPNGQSVTQGDPFFEALGTNGRTCFTCHRPGYGWGFTAGHAQTRFTNSNGTDPLFRVIDGAVCPTDNVSTPAAMQNAYRLLLSQGLIRIGLTVPSNPQFSVAVAVDPDGCTGNPATGLTSPTTGTVNVYRRPLQTANLSFVKTFMWDGREPSLQHQAVDAAETHEQAATSPSTLQQNEIVAFESGLFVAQSNDTTAGDVLAGDAAASGATAGPVSLSKQPFFVGINDPFGQNPTATPFTPNIFSLFNAWAGLTGTDATTLARLSVARGQQIFNSRTFAITKVGGLNDVANQATITGTCGTCHDTPNVGNASVQAFLNIGVTAANPPVLDVSQLPVFVLTCTTGPLTGTTFAVTDPGRAMTTGSCADIGKTKIPTLRALGARAPYFHNGTGTSLLDVVRFYEKRFAIPFSQQDETDLVNFLGSL